MLRRMLLVGLGLVGWLRLARLHLGIANEAGSRERDKPFEISDPLIAQAIYGRLEAGKEAEYYAFQAQEGARVRALLLIPTPAYQKGLRAGLRLYGPGFPAEGLRPETTAHEMRIANRDYFLVQSYVSPLAGSGRFEVTVEREAGAGTYVFGLGDREGGYADAAMRARIEALLVQDA